MRIYTNFDLWNVMKFFHGLGKASYQEVEYDLDQEEDLTQLVQKLIEDKVVAGEGINVDVCLNWSSQLPLKGVNELDFLNHTKEGIKGNRQLGTLVLNLIEFGLLVQETQDFFEERID